MICFTKSSYKDKAKEALQDILGSIQRSDLDKYGRMGVTALANATPKNTNLASNSWRYEIIRNGASSKIIWYNDDIENGYNVAILIQYGHGTKNGTYVQGVDYINPALAPVFEAMKSDIEKEVARK